MDGAKVIVMYLEYVTPTKIVKLKLKKKKKNQHGIWLFLYFFFFFFLRGYSYIYLVRLWILQNNLVLGFLY